MCVDCWSLIIFVLNTLVSLTTKMCNEIFGYQSLLRIFSTYNYRTTMLSHEKLFCQVSGSFIVLSQQQFGIRFLATLCRNRNIPSASYWKYSLLCRFRNNTVVFVVVLPSFLGACLAASDQTDHTPQTLASNLTPLSLVVMFGVFCTVVCVVLPAFCTFCTYLGKFHPFHWAQASHN